jgi:hypothetical protein
LPIGQKIALDYLETYVVYCPMQAPASYNLSRVMEEIKKQQQMHATKPGASMHFQLSWPSSGQAWSGELNAGGDRQSKEANLTIKSRPLSPDLDHDAHLRPRHA